MARERTAAVDADNDFDAATTVPMLFSDSGTVGGQPAQDGQAAEDPSDFYTFVADQTGNYRIELTNITGNIRLNIYDSDRNLIDTVGGLFSSSKIALVNVSPGRTYYIELQPFYLFDEQDFDPATYDITTTLNPFVGGADSNNSFETAGVWDVEEVPALGSRTMNRINAPDITLGGEIDPDDFFTFTAIANDIVTITLYNQGDDFDIIAYDSSRQPIASSDNDGIAPESVQFEVTAGQQYFVHIDAGDSQGGYRLDVVFADGDEFFESAREVTFSDLPSGNIRIGDPHDMLRFEAEESGIASITVSSFFRDVDLEIYDSNQQLISEAKNITPINDSGFPANDTATFSVAAGRTYFVKVLSPEAFTRFGASGTYNLSSTIEVIPPDENNTLADAQQLEAPSDILGDVGAADEDDFYRFEATADGRADISLHGLTDNLDLRIYNEAGELIAESKNEGTNGESIIIAVSENQTYFVRVSPTALAYSEYDLSISFSERGEDSSMEIPSDASTERSLLLNEQTDGLIDGTGDSDWYGLIVPEGSTYVVRATGSGANAISNPDLVLRSADGNFIAQDVEEGTERAEITVPQPGSYYIEVRSYTGDTGSFNLSVISTATASSPEVSDEADIAGNTSSETVLAIGDTISSRIDSASDSDWFQVDVPEGDQITVRLQGAETDTGTLSDGTLVLRDENGDFIEQVVAGAGSNSEITIVEAGSYWIDIRSSAGVTGTYQLSTSSLTQDFEDDDNEQPAPIDGADIPGDSSTPAQVFVGSELESTLETSRDSDWYKVVNLPGDILRIRITSAENGNHTLLDPDLVLRDSSGDYLDQRIGDAGKDIVFDLGDSGSFFLDVRSYSGETGSYSVSVDYLVQSGSQSMITEFELV